MLRLTDCIRTTVCLVFAGAYASAAAEAPKATPKIEGNTIEGVRNARYCEIIPIVRDGLHLTATVYNTLGLNDCPPQVWDSITEDAMKQRFGAVTVLLNGPRYFLMDSITASGSTKAGEKKRSWRTRIDRARHHRCRASRSVAPALSRADHQSRHVYRFKAGLPVRMLEASDGSRYAMQAYSQIVDKTLTYDQLDALGSKLKLPSGWRYTTTTPDQDLVLGAQGKATVIQDDFDNTYQKLD